MKPVEVRVAGIADVAELSRVGAQSFIAAYRGTANGDDIDAHVEACFSEAAICRESKRPAVQYLIASVDATSAGLLKLQSGDAPPEVPAESALEVQHLYVASDHQRLGVGRRLMDAAVEEARRRGVAGIWLSVWTHAHWATAFYRAYGFVSLAEVPFTLGRTDFTDYLMWYSLVDD